MQLMLQRVCVHWQESAEATAVIAPSQEFVNHDALKQVLASSTIGLMQKILFARFVAKLVELVAIK